MHAANGWTLCEAEIVISQATGLAGKGGHTYYENGGGSAIINYAGRTDNWAGTTRYFFIGAYHRDYPSVHNWEGFGDIRFDLSGTVSNAGAHVARLMAGDASTLAACTILEPFDITAWADGGITGNFWKGSLPGGSRAYFYAFTEAGTVVVPTPSSAIVSASP